MEMGDDMIPWPEMQATTDPALGSDYFPVKLHRCLVALENEGLSHIASFQHDGRCFKVHQQPQDFMTVVLRRFFKHSKYTSFQRQLNIYGFLRITTGPARDSYYHPKFLRGQENLARQIPRVGIKGMGPRRPNFETSLDFHDDSLSRDQVSPSAPDVPGTARHRAHLSTNHDSMVHATTETTAAAGMEPHQRHNVISHSRGGIGESHAQFPMTSSLAFHSPALTSQTLEDLQASLMNNNALTELRLREEQAQRGRLATLALEVARCDRTRRELELIITAATPQSTIGLLLNPPSVPDTFSRYGVPGHLSNQVLEALPFVGATPSDYPARLFDQQQPLSTEGYLDLLFNSQR